MSELHIRTKLFAIEVCKSMQPLSPDCVSQVLIRQLVRSATSVGANHRAARRARSRADMIAKMKIVEEEADESCYWLELLIETMPELAPRMENLHRECTEILAMTVASIKTLRSRQAT